MSFCGENLEDAGIRYLPVCDIISLNRRMIALTPEEHFGVINQGGLESAQMRPAMYRYHAQTDDIFTLAAALGEGLIQNHCFMNANKRTAAGCVFDFLMLNGWELTAPEHEVKEIYEGMATKEYTLEELADWLACWSREYDTSRLND